MFNQVFLVGRIEELKTDYSDDRMNGMITLAVERQFPESNGEFLTDHFGIRVWRGMVETLKENYHRDDVVGVNGRIQNEDDDGRQLIIAEKISLFRKAEGEED